LALLAISRLENANTVMPMAFYSVTKKTEQPGRFSAFGINTPIKSTPAARYASGRHNKTPAPTPLWIGPFSFIFFFYLSLSPPSPYFLLFFLLSRRIIWVGEAATALTTHKKALKDATEPRYARLDTPPSARATQLGSHGAKSQTASAHTRRTHS
jgi:hypothetical protein